MGMGDIHDYVREMPKAELHIHHEGAVLPETLLKLADRHGVRLPARDLDGMRDFYTFRDFDHFVEVYMQINACLREVDDFVLITRELGDEAARQNVRYMEVTISPGTLHKMHGLSFEEMYEGVKDGARQAFEQHGVRMQFIVDIVRDIGTEFQWRGARWAATAAGDGVVALGLGGTEARYPAEDFREMFDFARAHGLHSVPHAGEHVGPPSVWAAIRALGAERIGHGVRSIEDPALVEYLAEHQILLEVSPTSNICTGAIPSWEEHPMRRLFEAGVPVTVNSDDPPMFNTTLTEEYMVLVDRFGFSVDELESITLLALERSFLPVAESIKLRQEFRQEYSRLRAKHGLGGDLARTNAGNETD
jgi:adenosine deaminase